MAELIQTLAFYLALTPVFHSRFFFPFKNGAFAQVVTEMPKLYSQQGWLVCMQVLHNDNLIISQW